MCADLERTEDKWFKDKPHKDQTLLHAWEQAIAKETMIWGLDERNADSIKRKQENVNTNIYFIDQWKENNVNKNLYIIVCP